MYCQERNGKYTFTERYTDPLTGRIKCASITLDKNTKQAQKMAQETLTERIKAIQQDPYLNNDKKIRLNEIADEYYKYQLQTVSKSTAERNKFSIKSTLSILGEDTIYERLTAGYIIKKMLETKKKPSTLNEHIKRFRAMIRWAYRHDLVENTVCVEKIELLKETPHRVVIENKYLEMDELNLLLSRLAIVDWRLLTQFLALTGMRFGEFCALEKSDIDYRSETISINKGYDSVNREVTNTKNVYSYRTLHMQPELVTCCKHIDRLMRFKKVHSKLFFHDETGGYVNYYSFNKYLKENSEHVIGRQITPHALRHTHASLLFEQGFTPDEIARRLGHGGSKITKEIYIHKTKNLFEKDSKKLDKVRFFQ